MEDRNPKSIQLSKKAMIMAVAIVLVLVIVAYVLTFVLPRGEYERATDASGNSYIVDGTYRENAELDGISFWQFLLSPFMVLLPSTEGSGIVYVIVVLMLAIGAVFTAMDECGILVYMVNTISHRFREKKYLLLFILSFCFMFMGSAVGMFEEIIPLVPLVVMLCYAFGWDALTGLGLSILAGCFGFACGVVNPFTVGVSQTLGNIPLFSGIGLRLLAFALAYIVLMAFMYPYAKRIDKNPQKSYVYNEDLLRKQDFNFDSMEFVKDPQKSKALSWLASWILVVVVCAIVSIFWHTLANYVMYITVVVYVIAGIGACMLCGIKGKALLKLSGKGMLTLLPAIFMILVAGGVRYIVSEGDIMDTILYLAISFISKQSSATAVLLIYGVIFIFEIFIPSGSAKAILLMPLIYNICGVVGIDGQVAVLALTFADGFSNMLLPTNASLLLILGLTTVDFRKWLKWSLPIQGVMLLVTCGILLLAHLVVYAA